MVARAGGEAGLGDKLAVMGLDRDPARREDRDPLVAIWLGTAAEGSPPALAAADLLLLGGGWALLEAVLDRLEPLAHACRAARRAGLDGLPGVLLPRTSGPSWSDSDFLPGGAPFAGR